MAKVFVVMQSKEKWEGDVVVCNGNPVSPSDPLRFRLHKDIRLVADKGKVINDQSGITIMRHRNKVFGKVVTEERDASGRNIPIVFLILDPRSEPSAWAADLTDGLELASKESGYDLPGNLIERVASEMSSTVREGGLLAAIVDAFVELVWRLVCKGKK